MRSRNKSWRAVAASNNAMHGVISDNSLEITPILSNLLTVTEQPRSIIIVIASIFDRPMISSQIML